jgi:hypothetical protein
VCADNKQRITRGEQETNRMIRAKGEIDMLNKSTMASEPARAVLEGVPSLSFYPHDGKVELCPFPACLKTCLETLGESVPYEYIMGTAGAAFRLLWHPEEWDGGNVDTLVMAEDPLEPHRRAFEAVGYTYEFLANPDYRQAPEITRQFDQFAGREAFLSRIVSSIRDRKRPVLALGVIGPPECSIITGYDEGGEVLIGWSFFQDMPEFHPTDEKEPSGYFRKRNWYADTAGLFLIGDKVEQPPRGELYRKALRWALAIARTPKVRRRASGLAAYTAWANALEHDAPAFATEEMDRLFWLYAVHNDATTMVAEGRWYASLFLANIAREEPKMAAALYQAAACYAAEHDLMWQVWSLLGGAGFSEVQARNLARIGIRHQIVPLIRQAREKDQEAANAIERALATPAG